MSAVGRCFVFLWAVNAEAWCSCLASNRVYCVGFDSDCIHVVLGCLVGTEQVSMGAFGYLFSELVHYCQQSVMNIADLNRKYVSHSSCKSNQVGRRCWSFCFRFFTHMVLLCVVWDWLCSDLPRLDMASAFVSWRLWHTAISLASER